MLTLAQCRGCRHMFVSNYRNRTKVKHKQEFCSKPACRRKARKEANRGYRKSEPELRDKVRLRVAACRQRRRAESGPPAAAASQTAAAGSGPPVLVTDDLQSLGRSVAQSIISEVEASVPRIATALALRSCTEIAGRLADADGMGRDGHVAAQI